MTDVEPTEILEFLAEKFDFQWSDETYLVNPGVGVGSFRRTNDYSLRVLEEECGFRPTLHVSFRLDKFEHRDYGYHIMLQATSALLCHIAGDAALFCPNNTTMLLKRVGDRLILNSIWFESAPEEIALPHEMEVLPHDASLVLPFDTSVQRQHSDLE
ncbi:hypothetical protein H6F43_09455 [Leptolyngbya sp. FACHB-36]|nr:hypothetical protein [Leptolyngbya sp. FACHB-36]